MTDLQLARYAHLAGTLPFGSAAQIDADNAFHEEVCRRMSEECEAAYAVFCHKATTRERVDEALAILVLPSVQWPPGNQPDGF